MAAFPDRDAAIDRFRRLFEALGRDPVGLKAAGKVGRAFRLRLREPEMHLFIDCRVSPPAVTVQEPGNTVVGADVEIGATGDVAHQIFSGVLGLGSAFGSGQVQFTGSYLKLLGLGPLLDALQRLYPAVCEEES